MTELKKGVTRLKGVRLGPKRGCVEGERGGCEPRGAPGGTEGDEHGETKAFGGFNYSENRRGANIWKL